jgi:hypothetical protein
MNSSAKIVEGQLRECYARVVYSHKAHEKCADILLQRHKKIKLAQIILSAVVTGGIVSTLSETWRDVATIVSAIFSTALLALNSYTKDYDLGEIAQKHRRAAADIWLIRENYLSLLTDLRAENNSVENICTARDKLLSELHAVYAGAPSTNHKAYKKAQEALKKLEDMTFSDKEVDAFLPSELKREE